MKKYICMAISLLIFTGLTACSEEPRDFTYYQAGQYKGGKDPLLNKELHAELNDRFRKVQTDR